jgi:hypothetical protein
MDKIKYKDYIGITRSKRLSISVKGMLVSIRFIKPPVWILDKIYRWLGIYSIYTEVLFWCPLKSTLSIGTYGANGKKSRGVYSNLWYELTDTNYINLQYLIKNATQRFNFVNWIRDCKFQKVTNKNMKKRLDEHLLF